MSKYCGTHKSTGRNLRLSVQILGILAGVDALNDLAWPCTVRPPTRTPRIANTRGGSVYCVAELEAA